MEWIIYDLCLCEPLSYYMQWSPAPTCETDCVQRHPACAQCACLGTCCCTSVHFFADAENWLWEILRLPWTAKPLSQPVIWWWRLCPTWPRWARSWRRWRQRRRGWCSTCGRCRRRTCRCCHSSRCLITDTAVQYCCQIQKQDLYKYCLRKMLPSHWMEDHDDSLLVGNLACTRLTKLLPQVVFKNCCFWQ